MGGNVRVRGAWPRWVLGPLLGALALLPGGCLLVPARYAPAVEGRVVDAATREPLADVLVVVRFDGRYDDILPDREILGHLEARTDASGRFRVGPLVRAGLIAWPYFRTEARVESALLPGYRCGRPRAVRDGRALVELSPALDEDDRRDSCRPVASERGEAVAYMDAWRALHESGPSREERERDHQLERLLAARTAFGFGENCTGPVFDLALAPGGVRAAVAVAGPTGREIRVLEHTGEGFGPPQLVASDDPEASRRLAWLGPEALALWGEASAAERAAGAGVFSEDPVEVVWRSGPALPAAPAPGPDAGDRAEIPLEPADLYDEADALWLGRSFALRSRLDPATGLAADRLLVTREDGTAYAIDLPGETCGPRGRFGRPHYRIAADARTALDLRFVSGGCHAVAIDLESGAWSVLDRTSRAASCREERAIPATQLGVGLRSYARDVASAVEQAGGDPDAAYVLRVDAYGTARVETRAFDGSAVTAAVPDFPLATPLRRIDVSVVGEVMPAPAGASSVPTAEGELEPL